MNAEYIAELEEVVRALHGSKARYIETVPVKEVHQGQTVWEGDVEVFALSGHPKANRVYAWAHESDDPDKPKRHVTVLHIPPVISPVMAVRASIINDYREANERNENN